MWGGSLALEKLLALTGLWSSFNFDYLMRFRGATSLTYAIVNGVPAPSADVLAEIARPVAEVVCQSPEFDALWGKVSRKKRPTLGAWEVAENRARIDAEVACAYGVSLPQYMAVLSTFPNIDRTQPMLPGEPKSFVTRDLALLAYCRKADLAPGNVDDLLHSAGLTPPPVRKEFRRVDARVAKYRELGAIPYRPSPKGGRAPTDPELVDQVKNALSADAQTAEEIAEQVEEEPRGVEQVLRQLVKNEEAFAEGRGRSRRYYVVEEA